MPNHDPLELECPLSRATRLFGDRWTLLILRDMMINGRRCFRELQRNSAEGIATNILSARLKRMTSDGLITRAAQPDAAGRQPYALTARAIDLLPAIIELGSWALAPAPQPADIRLRLVLGGGRKLWAALQAELREEHLHNRYPGLSIQTRLWETEAAVLSGQGPIYLPPSRRETTALAAE